MQGDVQTDLREIVRRLGAAADQLARAEAGARDVEAERQRLEAEVEAKRGKATAVLDETQLIHREVCRHLQSLALAQPDHVVRNPPAKREVPQPSPQHLARLESCLATARDTTIGLGETLSSLRNYLKMANRWYLRYQSRPQASLMSAR